MRKRLKKLMSLMLALVFLSGIGYAQPSASQLADDIHSKNNVYLSQIENIAITADVMGFTTTTRYVKSIRDGVAVLEPDNGEDGVGMYSSSMGKELADAVRASGSVSAENIDGFSAYKIVIEDPQLLHEMMNSGPDFEEEMSEVKQVTLWLDSSELILRKAYFESVTKEGRTINMEMLARDYKTHSGLPIAHTIEIRVEGLEHEVSDEEMEQARRGMAELEKQLSEMPEAQRKMIEKQLKPQLEKFQEMLGDDDGEMGNMTMQVTDVQVNRGRG